MGLERLNKARRMPRAKFALAALVCGLGAGAAGLFPRLDFSVRWRVPLLIEGDFVPAARIDPGEELVLVVVSSSACSWSNSDQFEKMVREGRAAIQRLSDHREVGFAVMGISRDVWPENGIEHLEKFGRFDEISVGRGWRNTSILKYVYGDFPGRAATPQILVLGRTLVREGGHWTTENERVLARKIGVTEIGQWIETGTPVTGEASYGH